MKRAYLDGNVQERKWQALVVRANEVRSFDLDELDDEGNLVLEEEEEEAKPAVKPKAKRRPRTSRSTKAS